MKFGIKNCIGLSVWVRRYRRWNNRWIIRDSSWFPPKTLLFFGQTTSLYLPGYLQGVEGRETVNATLVLAYQLPSTDPEDKNPIREAVSDSFVLHADVWKPKEEKK